MQDTVTINHKTTSSAPMAPWTMEEMVNDVLAMKALLVRETQALKSMDIPAVREMHEEKLRLVRKLELQHALLARDASLMQGVNDAQRKRLKDANADMQRVMKENFYEVLKAREVNSCVVRAISREVRKHEQRASGYNRRGLARGALSAYGDSNPAVALNQMI